MAFIYTKPKTPKAIDKLPTLAIYRNETPAVDNTFVQAPINVVERDKQEALAEKRNYNWWTSPEAQPPSRENYGEVIKENIQDSWNSLKKVGTKIIAPAAAGAGIGVMSAAAASSPILMSGVRPMISNFAKTALAGAGIDLGYNAVGGQNLGDALNLKNSVGRFAANMVSPGILAGAPSVNSLTAKRNVADVFNFPQSFSHNKRLLYKNRKEVSQIYKNIFDKELNPKYNAINDKYGKAYDAVDKLKDQYATVFHKYGDVYDPLARNVTIHNPNYATFLHAKNKFDFDYDKMFDEANVNEYVDLFTKSTRGVADAENEEIAKQYLTKIAGTGKGGQRLGPGLYTSNSTDIADRFSRGNTGNYTGDIRLEFPELATMSPREKVRFLEEKIKRTDQYVLRGPHYGKKVGSLTPEQLKESGIIAKQETYANRTGAREPAAERVIIDDSRVRLENVQAKDAYRGEEARGRWGSGAAAHQNYFPHIEDIENVYRKDHPYAKPYKRAVDRANKIKEFYSAKAKEVNAEQNRMYDHRIMAEREIELYNYYLNNLTPKFAVAGLLGGVGAAGTAMYHLFPPKSGPRGTNRRKPYQKRKAELPNTEQMEETLKN